MNKNGHELPIRITTCDEYRKVQIDGFFNGDLDPKEIASGLKLFLENKGTAVGVVNSTLPRLVVFRERQEISPRRGAPKRWEEEELRVPGPGYLIDYPGLNRVWRVVEGQGRQINGISLNNIHGPWHHSKIIVGSGGREHLEIELRESLSGVGRTSLVEVVGDGFGEIATRIIDYILPGRIDPDLKELARRHVQITSERQLLHPQEEWRVVKEKPRRLMSPELEKALNKIPSERARVKIINSI